MADIRIKDLATTASTTASDDFMAVDGTTNGTRKLSAATPSFATSVTVPGVVGPASTALTLTGGSTGASLVLGATTGGVTTLTNGGGVQSLRIDQANRVIIGTGGALQGDKLEIQSVDGTAAQSIWRFSADASGPILTFRKSRGATIAAQGLVSSGDTIGNLLFMASDGVASRSAAQIAAEVDGTAAASSMPGRLVFRTTPTGSVSLATAATLTSTGNLLIGTTTDAASLAGGLVVNGSGAGAAASSTTTGALRVTGGVGVSGSGYFGGAVVLLPSSGTVRGRINNDPGRADVFNVGANWNGASQDDNTKPSWFAQIDGRAAGDSYSIQRAAPAGAPTAILSASAAGVINIPATTSASSSTVGALTIGNGTAATNVAIGGGNVNAGGTGTFAGAVSIGNTVSSVSPTSPNRTITIVVGGVTLYIAAKTTND